MNFLFSYYFMQGKMETAKRPWREAFRQMKAMGVKVLIDSGAFSAYILKEPIELEPYMRWLAKWGAEVDEYIMLDVIRDLDATRRNFEIMVKHKLRPMGVMTADAPDEIVRDFIDVNPRVCVAGGVTKDASSWYPARLERVYRASDKRAQIHALGYTAGVGPIRSPVTTVDSSTWCVGQRFGKFSVWSYETGCRQLDFRIIKNQKFDEMPREVQKIMVESSMSCSIFQEGIGSRGQWSFISAITIIAWLRYADQLAARGVELYFVASDMRVLGTLAIALMHRKGETGIDWPAYMKDLPTVIHMIKGNWTAFWPYMRAAVENNREQGAPFRRVT